MKLPGLGGSSNENSRGGSLERQASNRSDTPGKESYITPGKSSKTSSRESAPALMLQEALAKVRPLSRPISDLFVLYRTIRAWAQGRQREALRVAIGKGYDRASRNGIVSSSPPGWLYGPLLRRRLSGTVPQHMFVPPRRELMPHSLHTEESKY
jgi:hypothetical protein